VANWIRQTLKRLVVGSVTFPQQCTIGLREPQSEVRVWLHGLGVPRDVTSCNVMTSAIPFTVGIGLGTNHQASVGSRTSLRFEERNGRGRLLGEIGLRLNELISVDGEQMGLFEVRHCRNYCLPRARLWMLYGHLGWQEWRASRRSKPSKIRLTSLAMRSLFVFYICPRPVVLVSVMDGSTANVFPMDLIGPIGARHFSLALHCTSAGVPSMERSRRIALSSVPFDQTSVAYELGKNHKRPCVDVEQLPFATAPSAAFGLPVPRFALRVREMQIEAVRSLGSHKFFLAVTINDQQHSDGRQLFFVHGFYQAWRNRTEA
jgi:flavin reductase (DIM6/NTAB) family NADH-FMN oxidoreductase RutF